MDTDRFADSLTILMKIVGAVAAVLSFRWIMKIWAGADGKFSVMEFSKFCGFIFFTSAGGYMLYKEGTRTHEWNLYSEWYVAIVFGSLLTVLHLDSALDKILKILIALKSKNIQPTTESDEAK